MAPPSQPTTPQGSEDGALTTNARALAALLEARPAAATRGTAGSTTGSTTATWYHELQGCGHVPQEERPQEFARILADFLGQLPATQR